MPTGYTAAVADGTVTTLNQFAMCCARSFGALVSMRDDPADAPIPKSLEPSPFYLNQVTRSAERLAELRRMSPSEAQRRCQQSHSAAMAEWRRQCDDNAIRSCRYKRMYAEVQSWEPPTADHYELQKFMLTQLKDSLDWDCGHVRPMPSIKRWPQWLADEVTEACEDMERYQSHARDELARVYSRNQWLAHLSESLAPEVIMVNCI